MMTLLLEHWKPIPLLENIYEASCTGVIRRLYSLKHPNRRLNTIKPQVTKKTGRLRVTISLHGRTKKYSVHTLVADAFIGSRPGGLEVNHIDGNHKSNRASNLEYLTRGENERHAFRVGLKISPNLRFSKALLDEVRSLKGVMPKRAIARKYGMSAAYVRQLHKEVPAAMS